MASSRSHFPVSMGSLASCGMGECESSPQKRGNGWLRQICTGWLEQLCGALVKMSPRSVKSLRRLAKFWDARDSCRASAPQGGCKVTKTAISRHLSSKSRPIRILYDVTHAGITPPAASRWVARVLSRIVRSVFSGTMPTRCNRTQCGDRHPATWAKWRQRRTQVLCVFRQNRRRRSPHPAPKSDATHQVLPQTWRHAVGFGIGHIWNKWRPASAAGRRNRALVPIRARWCPPWDACAVHRV